MKSTELSELSLYGKIFCSATKFLDINQTIYECTLEASEEKDLPTNNVL